MAHKELASKHGMHRILLEDGSLQRRMQGNNLDTPTCAVACEDSKCCGGKTWSGCQGGGAHALWQHRNFDHHYWVEEAPSCWRKMSRKTDLVVFETMIYILLCIALLRLAISFMDVTL